MDAARLGSILDAVPEVLRTFDVPDPLVDDVLALADELPQERLLELLDSAHPQRLREAARWFDTARGSDQLQERPVLLAPWSDRRPTPPRSP